MEPKKLHAGDSVRWHRAVPDFPASAGWSLHYALRGAGVVDIEALPGSPYVIEVSAAITREWPPGRYRWVAFVRHIDGERITLGDGEITIAPDWLAAESLDVRSHARRMLDLIEAALQKRIPKDQQSYTIDGQSIDRIPVERLEELRLRYRREVAREERSSSTFGRIIQARL